MANSGGIAGDQLRSLIERIERLEEERKATAEDVREVYGEAKAAGFDITVMRQLVRLRRLDSAEREEQEALLDIYRHAVGMAQNG